jgi:spore germination protein KA
VCLLNIHNATLGIRQSNDTENEFNVIGPKVGFVEDLDTNLNLLRKKVNSPKLVIEEMWIGYT